MIFLLGATEPVLVCALSEKDVELMRKGSTVFVDAHQLKAKTFTGVVFSLSKNDTATLDLLKKAGVKTDGLVHAEPKLNEARCIGQCNGVMAANLLFEGRCIVCWANDAKACRLIGN